MIRQPFQLMAKPIGPICNIQCEYCFYLSKEELFSHSRKSDFAMRDDVLESFIRQYIDAQPEGTRYITFAWQGGEPTLLPQVFFDKAVELENRYARPGMRILNALQTNAMLMNQKRAQWFKDNNFLIGVSIDGPEELHNRYRIDRSGKGTFSRVITGLENLKAVGAEFNTLTVVQDHNSQYPQRVYEFLKSIGSTFLQFIPIVEPLTGGVSKRTVSAASWGTFMTGIFNQWIAGDIGEIFVQHFDLLLGLHAGYPPSLCVHSETCGNALAIEHDGSIYSCDHFVTPQFQLGNITEHALIDLVEGPFQRQFGRDKRDTLPDKCRSCQHLKLCWGACPKNRLREFPGGKLNWLCEGYYSLYEHTKPHFKAMVRALAHRRPATEFRDFFVIDPINSPLRNDPCPCGSQKKFKHCHGR